VVIGAARFIRRVSVKNMQHGEERFVAMVSQPFAEAVYVSPGGLGSGLGDRGSFVKLFVPLCSPVSFPWNGTDE
jgi:hypothetical protein